MVTCFVVCRLWSLDCGLDGRDWKPPLDLDQAVFTFIGGQVDMVWWW